MNFKVGRPSRVPNRCSLPRQENTALTPLTQTAHQQKYLPLTAAHLTPGIYMQNPHVIACGREP